MSPLFRILLLAALSTSVIRCSSFSKTLFSDTRDELVIVATADYHSAIDRAEGLASTIAGLRKKYGARMIYLDGGDLFQGSLEGNSSKGLADVTLFNLMKLDAAAIGNHELDYGPTASGRISVRAGEDGLGNIRVRVADAKFKWLSANFIRTRNIPSRQKDFKNALGHTTVFEPHAIFEKNGHKVCVIGATTPMTYTSSRPSYLKGTEIMPLTPVVTAEAKYLRTVKNCDFVLLTAHAGLECDDRGKNCQTEGIFAEILRMVREMPPGTLDAVVAGHSHVLAQEVIGKTPVLQAGADGKNVGVLKIYKDHRAGRFESFLTVPEKAEMPEVTAALKPFRDVANQVKAKPVGESKALFFRDRNVETALGNLMADAFLDEGRKLGAADFAMMNSGGIRNDLQPGPITYGDLFKVCPFDNNVAIVTFTGAELRRFLEIAESGAHGVSYLSGLKIRRQNIPEGKPGPWDRDLNSNGIKETWERNLLVDVIDLKTGKSIDNQRTYRLILSDFIAAGGDHQRIVFGTMNRKKIRIFPGKIMRDVLVNYVRKHSPLSPEKFYNPASPRIEQ